MAFINTYKSYLLSNYIRSVLRKSLTSTTIRAKSMLMELDTLDDFTTQLMQKKTDKWDSLKVRRQFPLTRQVQLIDKQFLQCQLKDISANNLNALFEELLTEGNQSKIFALIEECICYQKCPSDLTMTNVLTLFAQTANIKGILKIEELCLMTNGEYLRVNSNLKPYLAEAIWLKGNVLKAIDMFEEVYNQNPFLRRRIRLVLKYLITEAVMNRSEAILVNLVSFTERLVKKYKDFYIMTCLWQSCFLSEWFSDQQIALDLLDRNCGLSKALVPRIPHVVSISLKHHKTDAVYRLLEVLLKYEIKLHSSIVLVALFDYRYRQGDLKSCCEILNWSTKYNILLPSIQHEKFLRLLLKGEAGDYKKKIAPSKYEFKF